MISKYITLIKTYLDEHSVKVKKLFMWMKGKNTTMINKSLVFKDEKAENYIYNSSNNYFLFN